MISEIPTLDVPRYDAVDWDLVAALKRPYVSCQLVYLLLDKPQIRLGQGSVADRVGLPTGKDRSPREHILGPRGLVFGQEFSVCHVLLLFVLQKRSCVIQSAYDA